MSRFTPENISAHAELVGVLTIFTMAVFLVVVGARIFARTRLMGTGFLMDDGMFTLSGSWSVVG